VLADEIVYFPVIRPMPSLNIAQQAVLLSRNEMD